MRRVIVLRHAIAEDRDEAARGGIPDERRALTDRGIRRMRATAAGIATVEDDIVGIAHSPLTRATETARLLADACPKAVLDETRALTPGVRTDALFAYLAAGESRGTMCVVGHEPGLGEWLGEAVAGPGAPPMPLKKAGAALLRFAGEPCAGGGELEWFLPPRLSRRLGT
ncbi:SixA phosphatase family protein [Arhodomonas sp. AD133]|uniref:SixA phosphatase family protein n=1 Tax=Arhodomonas sp. AD133 TaxID=3415009 RepID=UPI003EB9D45E